MLVETFLRTSAFIVSILVLILIKKIILTSVFIIVLMCIEINFQNFQNFILTIILISVKIITQPLILTSVAKFKK